MKRIIAFLTAALTLLINFTSGAQQNADNKSLLWQITGKGLTKPSYLFGTMHQICGDDYIWTDKMKSSLDKSEKVCFEMDMDDPGMMMAVTNGMIDNSGKELKDYFTPAQYELVKQYVKDSLGLDIIVFQKMKPVMLQTMMSLKDVNCNNPVSYEENIMKDAQKDNKEILGLEEPAEQLKVLETIPVDTIITKLLEEITQHKKEGDEEYQKLILAYKQQDIPALYQMITDSKSLNDDMGEFLDVRNKKWIPRMSDKMKKSSIFFAVGAGHLWGDNGVINLLRRDGYKVESVK